MALVAFLQAGSTSVYAGSWRHPATDPGYLDAAYYADLGRLLEHGRFDLMFFDDRLAMPGIYGGSVAEAVRTGARPVKLDLSMVLGVAAGATSRIGLGATYSTTYYAPFHVARTFSTLDHLSGGRAAWNVVTSVNDSEAQNFGLAAHLGHDERYDRADEFLEATAALWDSWEDDALVLDRPAGVYADPDRVHEVNFHGGWFDVRGPLTLPRSPQGRPVIIQAGSSGRGRDFASRWAELIFTGDPGLAVATDHYRDQKQRIADAGRDPDEVKICPMAYAVVGESEAHAAEREATFLNDLVDPMASLTLLSELMNYDFSAHALDDPVTDELIASVSGIRGLVQNLKTHIGADLTLRDLAGHRPPSCRGPGSWAPAPRWPTRWRSGSPPRRATASCWRPPTCPAPSRTWCAWWSPSCSGGGCSAPSTPAPRCATTWGCGARPAGRRTGPGRCPSRDRHPVTTGALDGLRVVDAATLAAGPLVATTLGEFGADVIKVEQPGAGDPLRRWGEQRDGVGLVWKSVSRNKRCVTLDLRRPEGQDLLHRLLDLSDVLVLNNRPSALARWNLDPATLVERHPRLVVVHISGFGAGGPYSDRPGFGTLAEAMSGFAHITGSPEGPPTLPPFMLADGVASLAATNAVLAALHHRDVSGGAGQVIDVSLIEPLARLIESATLTFDQLGRSPGRAGNRWDTSAPRNTYRTADGRWVAMSSAAPAIAQRVFRAVGRDEWADDPDRVDPIGRLAHATEIDAEVARWVGARPLSEVMETFDRLQVAAAPVYDAEQLLADPHLAARGTFVTMDDDQLGAVRVQSPTTRLSATPGRIDHLGPPVGAHNHEVWTDLVGLSADDLERLHTDGTI
jgi:FMN-dependent oxidoreductase (nitrilotriacetate monooxygenase family)